MSLGVKLSWCVLNPFSPLLETLYLKVSYYVSRVETNKTKSLKSHRKFSEIESSLKNKKPRSYSTEIKQKEEKHIPEKGYQMTLLHQISEEKHSSGGMIY
jgi:hypothetical protein